MYTYPHQPAIPVTPTQLPPATKQLLRQNLPAKTIFRVFGTVSSGKGTLSQNLSEFFQIPNIDSGSIWRALTNLYVNLELPVNPTNTQNLLHQIQGQIQNQKLVLSYQGKPFQETDLRNPKVDQAIADISKEDYNRQLWYEFLSNLFPQIQQAFVLDGRGASTPYLTAAEKNGYRIIRLLLDADVDTRVNRRLSEYLQSLNPSQSSNDQHHKILQTKELLIHRDQQDILTAQKLNLGLTTPDTGFINTTDLDPKQVLDSALGFIFHRLQPTTHQANSAHEFHTVQY